MDMKITPRLRVGIGQGFAHETEKPQLVVRIRSGQEARRGSFVGNEGRPVAFCWLDDAAATPGRELVIRAEKSGRYLWEDGKPVELANLFPKDKQVARIEKRLSEWQGEFERHYKPQTPGLFKWGRYHEEGIRLARQLQAVLIDRAVIRYCRPQEDRQSRFAPEIAL
mgnify:CR=1 FL=1|jgi:hypothetical protein